MGVDLHRHDPGWLARRAIERASCAAVGLRDLCGCPSRVFPYLPGRSARGTRAWPRRRSNGPYESIARLAAASDMECGRVHLSLELQSVFDGSVAVPHDHAA